MNRARNESNDHRDRTSTSGSRPNMGDGLPALLPSGLRKDRSPVRLAFEPHGGTFHALSRARFEGTNSAEHLFSQFRFGGWAPQQREIAMKVGSCMTKDVAVANPEQSIREVALMMGKLDAGVVPVGENDRLVGMITDRDMVIRGIALGKGPDTRVRDVMSQEVRYCFDDEDVDHVLANMGDLQVRRLPVLNRDKRLVGIISLGDLARKGETREAGEALSGISAPGGVQSQTAH